MFEFYKLFYRIGPKISKRDRFGIYATADRICLDVIQDIIGAALESGNRKIPALTAARVRVEILKRLIRLMRELNIVQEKWYVAIESELQEISKMLNGWIRYCNNQRPA